MNKASEATQPTVYTIGHSNRPIDVFLDLLKENKVDRIIDIRTVPRSRHNPQFAREELSRSLEEVGIAYTYMANLGGLRKTRADSPNTGWHNLSFRGYADHMQSPEFAEGVETVLRLAAKDRCALMCAEAVPWRCHRSLVGDALLLRGAQVEDIMGPSQLRPHKLTPFARVDGLQITYPPDDSESDGQLALPGLGQ